jgi:Serine/threonine protein kinase
MQHLQPNTTLQGGKYRIEHVLGQGGFGNTYVGYNTEFEETVAIKEFFMKGVTERDETTSVVSVSNADNVQQFEEQREKFKKEARRLRKLKNEHIVKVHDLFEENGTAYYVMDYIEGESLTERIKRTGAPLTEVEVRSILSQVLEALKEVHQNEIWHLDLKPGNIMIDKGGNAYLIDFGASKQIRANGSMTTSTALCYTPGYAPNEQIGQMYDRFGPWTDIYALGATVYNLLTNKKPPMAIDIEEDEEDAFDFPTTVSDEMRKLVVWMMQPKRKARPQNVDEMISKMSTSNNVKQEHTQLSQNDEETLLSGYTNNDDEETIISTNPQINAEKTILEAQKPEQKKSDVEAYDERNVKCIDLGLSVKWASCNIGANPMTPQGGLYGWGDSIGNKKTKKIEDYLEYRGGMYLTTPHNISGTKYDIATHYWGKEWRIPTVKEWKELVTQCTWTIETFSQYEGYRVVGPNGNSIFLPFTGKREGTTVSDSEKGFYWTSEMVPYSFEYALCYFIDKDKNDIAIIRNHLYLGHAIRPICDKN